MSEFEENSCYLLDELFLNVKSTILHVSALRYAKAQEECAKKTSHLAPIRLKKDLLCDYEKNVRPIVNHNNATNVTIRMVLKFFSYDMHSNQISIHNWLGVYWKDEHLKWDPSQYENIKQIHLSSQEIWVPDLAIYNMDDLSGSPSAFASVDCLVLYSGTVVCVPPGRHDGLCMPNLARYPFDKQNCSVRYGSWVHSGEEINFKIPETPVSLGDYVENGDWKLLKVEVVKKEGKFACCPNNTYPSIVYRFIIERHSATHAATIIIPAIMLIVLTLTTLWMNPEEMHRMCLACTNLMIHVMYFQMLTWQIPSSGDNPPLLIIYGRDSVLLCTLSIVLTVVLKQMRKSNGSSPMWISSFLTSILSNRPGQFLLLYETGLKNSEDKEDDTTAIINDSNATPSSLSKDWKLFAKLIDRLSFIAFSITYLCMFFSFIP